MGLWEQTRAACRTLCVTPVSGKGEVGRVQVAHVLGIARQEGAAQLEAKSGGAQRETVAGPVHERSPLKHAPYLWRWARCAKQKT